MSALLKSQGARFAAQRFSSWLSTIDDSTAAFLRHGEYTLEERETWLNRLADAIRSCEGEVDAGLSDSFKVIEGTDPRDWFATTLTKTQELQILVRRLHRDLNEPNYTVECADRQDELRLLRTTLQKRARAVGNAAKTLPADKVDDAPGYLGLIVEQDGTVHREGFCPPVPVQVSGSVARPMFLALLKAAEAGLSKQELARLPGDKGTTARRKVKQNLKDKLQRPLNITIPDNEWKLTEA